MKYQAEINVLSGVPKECVLRMLLESMMRLAKCEELLTLFKSLEVSDSNEFGVNPGEYKKYRGVIELNPDKKTKVEVKGDAYALKSIKICELDNYTLYANGVKVDFALHEVDGITYLKDKICLQISKFMYPNKGMVLIFPVEGPGNEHEFIRICRAKGWYPGYK